MRKNVSDSVWSLDCSEYDGELETALRYVEFSIDEIKKCSLCGSRGATMRHVQKLGEGMYVAFCVSISSGMFYKILQ
jgi:hypothetical protein